jgi:hypothetical protein
MFSSVADGLKAAGRNWKLVVLLWAWYLLIALVPALPGLAWLRSGLDFTPAAADALRRFDFGLLGDLSNYDRSGVISLLTLTMMSACLVAIVSSAFVMGGVLEVLGGDADRRTFMHRFARGGGHFFWRFVRLTITAGGCAGLAAGIVAAVVGAVTVSMGDREWEAGGYLAGFLTVISVAVTAALFLLALDYARIRVARDDSQRMLRAYVGALGFVVRHLVGVYGIALSIVVMLAAVFLGYLAWETNSPVASTAGLIALLVVLQQIATAFRVFARVALVGAERAYFGRMAPVVIPAPVMAAGAADVLPAAVVEHAAVVGPGASTQPADQG